MKNTTNNRFETFLRVCRLHIKSGRVTADVPLIHIYADGPADCYAVYQNWDETDDPTVWNAQLKVAPADIASSVDLALPWINIIELPPMRLADVPDCIEGDSVRENIRRLKEARSNGANEADPEPVDISGDPVIDRVLTWVRDTFPGARMDRIQQPDIPDWLVEPLRQAERKDVGTDCLILSGSHEFGTQSYAGEMRFYRNPEDNVQVAIPNGMKWGTAVGNLKKVTEDLEFWISVRTNTTIEDLDMITEREIDSPFPPF